MFIVLCANLGWIILVLVWINYKASRAFKRMGWGWPKWIDPDEWERIRETKQETADAIKAEARKNYEAAFEACKAWWILDERSAYPLGWDSIKDFLPVEQRMEVETKVNESETSEREARDRGWLAYTSGSAVEVSKEQWDADWETSKDELYALIGRARYCMVQDILGPPPYERATISGTDATLVESLEGLRDRFFQDPWDDKAKYLDQSVSDDDAMLWSPDSNLTGSGYAELQNKRNVIRHRVKYVPSQMVSNL